MPKRSSASATSERKYAWRTKAKLKAIKRKIIWVNSSKAQWGCLASLKVKENCPIIEDSRQQQPNSWYDEEHFQFSLWRV